MLLRGGSSSSAQFTPLRVKFSGTGLSPLWVAWKPKVVLAPWGSPGAQAGPVAVTDAASWETSAFQALVTCWPESKSQPRDHWERSADSLVTVTSAVKPEPQSWVRR